MLTQKQLRSIKFLSKSAFLFCVTHGNERILKSVFPGGEMLTRKPDTMFLCCLTFGTKCKCGRMPKSVFLHSLAWGTNVSLVLLVILCSFVARHGERNVDNSERLNLFSLSAGRRRKMLVFRKVSFS